MRKIVISIVFLFLFPASYVLADEGHSHSNNVSEDIEKFMNEEQSEAGSHEGHTMTPEEHSQMTNGTHDATHNESSTEDGHGSSGTDGNMDMDMDMDMNNETNSEGGHGHGGAVIEETPPNYTVLSVFSAINLSFLAVGLWNKRIRKKVKLDVDTGK